MNGFIKFFTSDITVIVSEIMGIILFGGLNILYGRKIKQIKSDREDWENKEKQEKLMASLTNDKRR